MAYTREQFIQKVVPMVQEEAKQSQILPSVTIAQAILESNTGNSRLTREAKALFGVKTTSSWRGKVWTGSTIEYYDDNRTSIIAGFRAYDSWEDSIADHSRLLTKNARYKDVIGEKDYKKAARALQSAGYATDPHYANKLITLIEQNKLYEYDQLSPLTDVSLFNAVSKIVKSGIELEFNKWKREDLIQLDYVPTLLCKLAYIKVTIVATDEQYKQAVAYLVAGKIIGDRSLWEQKKYQAKHVRALLIKYAASLA